MGYERFGSFENSTCKVWEGDRQVDEKPSNPMGDWGGKPTSQKRVTILRALATPLGIGRQKRSIDKKPSNPSRKQGKKTKRSGFGFFSSNLEPALSLQREIERFVYCELPSGQVSCSFMVVLGDSVDLVCSRSGGSGFCRLDVYLKRGNSLVGLVYITDKANLVSSMRIAGKIILYTAERVTSYTTAILVCRIDYWCRQAHFPSC